ncbi:MAG: hypothetical protein ACR2QB_05385 [Gammaproteobacteria bacterium]
MADQQAAVHAEVPPHKPKESNVVDNFKTNSGFEGREEQLGKGLNVMLKTLSNTAGYAHEVNDALVKMHLNAMQFAKDQGKIDEWVEHDVKTMAPINARMENIIRKTGQKEIALVGLFDRTACFYQLALENEREEGVCRWKEPFGYVLDKCKKIGQFDLTPEEIHDKFYRPRLLGYAKDMGVEMEISDIDEDGWITCKLINND